MLAGSKSSPASSFTKTGTQSRGAVSIGAGGEPKTSGSETRPVVPRFFAGIERPTTSSASPRRARKSSLTKALMPSNATSARIQGIHAIRCWRIGSFSINLRQLRERWRDVNRLLGGFSASRPLVLRLTKTTSCPDYGIGWLQGCRRDGFSRNPPDPPASVPP